MSMTLDTQSFLGNSRVAVRREIASLCENYDGTFNPNQHKKCIDLNKTIDSHENSQLNVMILKWWSLKKKYFKRPNFQPEKQNDSLRVSAYFENK